MQRLTTRHATVRRVPIDSVTLVMVQEFIKFLMGHGEFSHHDIDAVRLKQPAQLNGLVCSLLLNPPSHRESTVRLSLSTDAASKSSAFSSDNSGAAQPTAPMYL